jgi:hypothetical protein
VCAAHLAGRVDILIGLFRGIFIPLKKYHGACPKERDCFGLMRGSRRPAQPESIRSKDLVVCDKQHIIIRIVSISFSKTFP